MANTVTNSTHNRHLPAFAGPTARTIDDEVLRAFPGAPRSPLPTCALNRIAFRRRIDAGQIDRLVGFMARFLDDASALGLSGFVVGLSGGVDSVVCAELARRACGNHRSVTAVTVLIGDEPERRRLSALGACAARLGVEHVLVDGGRLHAAMQAAWPAAGTWTAINNETRAIQSLIFQIADTSGGSVVATTDRSETLLGRYTECFYGQLAPLAKLYKSEVIELAHMLGLASAIASPRPGCDGHWYDDEVLGAGYDVVDPILHLLGEAGLTPEEIGATYRIDDVDWIRGLRRRMQQQPLRIGTQEFDPWSE